MKKDTLSSQRQSMPMPQLAFRADTKYALLRFVGPLLVAVCISTVILALRYQLPYARTYPLDAWIRWASGVYQPEKLDAIDYVHTNGRAVLRFPDIGTGNYVLSFGLAGPGGATPTTVQLATETQQIALGERRELRVNHLFVPANASGDLVVQITSQARQVAPDPRLLGALITALDVQVYRPTLPPTMLVFSTAGTLLLFWLSITRLDLRRRQQVTSLLGLSVILGSMAVWARGVLALGPVWAILALCSMVSLVLIRSDVKPAFNSWRGVALLIASWRVALWIVGLVGLWYSQTVYYYGRGNAFNFGTTIGDQRDLLRRALATAWLQWDSEHYTNIAQSGYTFAGVRWPNVAFFPLYPLLIRGAAPLVRDNIALAALLVAHVALFCALLLLYDLLVRDLGRVIAFRTILLLLAFPTAFFFVAGYTESLALALTVAAVWTIRRERWWLAGIVGALLAMTRVPGVLIAPVIGIAYMQQQQWRWRSIRPPLLAMLLPPLGLGLFMVYQWWRFQTPWAFLIAQRSWNNGAGPPWAIPLKLWDALQSPQWEMAVLQFVVWMSILGLSLLALRRLPLVYGLTGLLLLLPAYLAQQEDSIARHVLIGFPAFVVLAQLTDRIWLRWAITTLMLTSLTILTFMFVNGFFIA